jgi:hypothetical protein
MVIFSRKNICETSTENYVLCRFELKKGNLGPREKKNWGPEKKKIKAQRKENLGQTLYGPAYYNTAVIIIKHVHIYICHKDEIPYVIMMIFDLIEKFRYAFYDYDGSITVYRVNQKMLPLC